MDKKLMVRLRRGLRQGWLSLVAYCTFRNIFIMLNKILIHVYLIKKYLSYF
jgi:hypothetical protein